MGVLAGAVGASGEHWGGVGTLGLSGSVGGIRVILGASRGTGASGHQQGCRGHQ